MSRVEESSFREELLFRPGPAPGALGATGDGTHVFWLEPLAEGEHVQEWTPGTGIRLVVDGVPGAPFDLPLPDKNDAWYVRSPDGGRFAICVKRGRDLLVITDQGEGPMVETLSRSVGPTFSPDGGRLAYAATLGGRMRLIVDGEPYTEFQPAPQPPLYSPDGRRIVFVAMRDGLPAGMKADTLREWLVDDGAAGPEWEGISASSGRVVISPDGAHVAYPAARAGRWRYVVDGQEGPDGDEVANGAYSPDSQRFAYTIRRGRLVAMVESGTLGPWYEQVGPGRFAPDSRGFAYVVRSKGQFVIVRDGRESTPFDEGYGEGPTYSPDSRHLAYLVRHGGAGLFGLGAGKWRLELDGEPGPEFASVNTLPHYSPDGSHIAFGARRGSDAFVVVDGVPGSPYEKVGPPRFSATGRLAYLAMRGKALSVAFDGRTGPEMSFVLPFGDDVPFVFSPDGEHIVYAGTAGGQGRPFVDHVGGPQYAFLGDPVFGSGEVHMIASRGVDGLFRVSCRLA